MKQPKFLPMTLSEIRALGWDPIDILLVTGDAYVDHPAFGAAVIGRWLVSQGYKVGIIAQPDWRDPDSVTVLGRPNLFAGVTAGAMDSLVANYTANKKLRRDDAYSPGDQHGRRPNRATLVYTSLVRHAFPKLPVVLGGIEASLRRLAHYDYWEDKVRRSLLLDAKADILVYGMGERSVTEIARRIQAGEGLDGISGTARIANQVPDIPHQVLPGYEEVARDPKQLLAATLAEEKAPLAPHPQALVQPHGERCIVVHAPAVPLSRDEMDAVYALPFARAAHPSYTEKVPALAPVLHSVISHRGCYGGCTFCALGAHQGRTIQSRSERSVLNEIEMISRRSDFHGTITDIGGPSANMYATSCSRPHPCSRPSCLFPEICPHLRLADREQIGLLRQAGRIKSVKHVFVSSGVRHDLLLHQPGLLAELVQGGHIGGTLKIAPEHIDSRVLNLMRKPKPGTLSAFARAYARACQKSAKPSGLNAYFISAFPGSRPEHMRAIGAEAKRLKIFVEQMQDFIPLPMTLAGAMYHAGIDPWSGEKLDIPRSMGERKTQRAALLQERGSGRVPRRSDLGDVS